MFSSLYYRILRITLFLTSIQGSIPWSWNSKTNRLIILPRVKIWHRCTTAFIGFLGLYAILRTMQARQRDVHQFVIATGMTFFATLDTVAMILCSLYAEEVASFFNGMLDYSVKYQSNSNKFLVFLFAQPSEIRLAEQWIPKYDVNTSKVNYYFDRGILFIILTLHTAIPLVSIHYFAFPLDMIYPPSLLPENLGKHPVVYWGFGPRNTQLIMDLLAQIVIILYSLL